jgi:hypothetical protein
LREGASRPEEAAVSVDGPSGCRSYEAFKRKQAEQLLADIYDVSMVLVSACAGTILKPILPYFPYELPPAAIAELGIVDDTIMAWVTEALERGGVPQLHRPTEKAGPVFDFKRPTNLGSQGAKLSVEEAMQQLARVRPNTREWYRAKQVSEEATKRLRGVSPRLVQRDADTPVVRVPQSQQGPTGIPIIKKETAKDTSESLGSVFDRVTAAAAKPTIAKLEPGSPTIVALRDREKLIEIVKTPTKFSQRGSG